MRAASSRLRVAATSGTCSVTHVGLARAASSSVRGSTLRVAPTQRSAARQLRVEADRRACRARAPSRAVSRPMPPKPTTPSVLPAISRPLDKRRARPRARGDVAPSIAYAPRSSIIAVPITYSATASAFAPVAGITSMPRASHAATSMLSSPTPSRPTTLSRGAAASSSASTCVRLRTISASASPICALQRVAPVDQRRVVERLVTRRQQVDGGRVHELADDDAHRTRRSVRSLALVDVDVACARRRVVLRIDDTSRDAATLRRTRRHCVRCQRTPQPGHTPPVANVNHSVPQRGRQLQRASGPGFHRQRGQRISGVFIALAYACQGSRSRSTLPPERMMPTRAPPTSSERSSRHASGTADDGSIDDLHLLPRQAHRAHDRLLARGADRLDVRADRAERARRHRRAQPVGDRRRRCDTGSTRPDRKPRDASSAFAGSAPNTRMPRTAALRRDRRARQQAAAADRRDDDVELRHVLEQLERRRALPRDDVGVVERMDQRRAGLALHLGAQRLARQRRWARRSGSSRRARARSPS